MNKDALNKLVEAIYKAGSHSDYSSQNQHAKITINDALNVCSTAKSIFEKEKMVLDLTGPINICGDLHGNLSDLLNCFKLAGKPPSARWLFLGDYVDRGPCSIEVITLLFALKILYPTQVYLIRGNHECMELTEIFGFSDECLLRYETQGEKVWTAFCDVFDYIPAAAIVSNDFLCIHGGISPKLETVQQIRDLKRPLKIPTRGFVTDLFWSDPSKETEEFCQSDRGTTCIFGLKPVKRFLEKNNLKHIIRAHQMVPQGYDFPFSPDSSVITIFTASNYEDDIPNNAAFIKIDRNGKYDIVKME